MVCTLLGLAVAAAVGDLAAGRTEAGVSGGVVQLHEAHGDVQVVQVALVREEELGVVLLHRSERAGHGIARTTTCRLDDVTPQPLLHHLWMQTMGYSI